MPSNDSRPALLEPDQARDIDLRHGVPAMRAGQHLVEVNRQRVDRDLLARHADQNASAVGVSKIVRELDHLFDAGGLDDFVGTLVADDLADLSVHVAGR